MSSEIGPSLSVAELRALATAPQQSIVVLRREDRAIAVTVWLVEVTDRLMHFLARRPNLDVHLLAFIDGDELRDDTGKRLLVNAYLGEP